MPESIENKILSKIYGHGKGWAFSQKDFTHLGSRGAIDIALHRLTRKGIIRRVIRGIYDYPRYSKILKTELSPDTDKVASALSRKFGWSIQPSGHTALNLLGLSTQVPGQIIYLSNGPSRKYDIGGHKITFKHEALKESGFKLRESGLIVQALKTLGKDNITPGVTGKLRKLLDSNGLRDKVLEDIKTATGWVYDTISRLNSEDSDGERSTVGASRS